MTDVIFEGKVRDRDTDTSWDAASRQTEDKLAAVQQTIVVLLGTRGDMTDEALVDAYTEYRESRPQVANVTPQSIRTRRHELHVAGRVKDTGRRLPTRAGSTAAVWSITQHGHHDEPTS
jgi:hypothetical protein